MNFFALAIFLRALIAPLYLVAVSVLGLAASLGLTTYLFQTVLGYDDLTYYVPFGAAVLLLALGSDYNVFVAGRIWEEARWMRLREAIAVATPAAAKAVTVAGLALAASFALLAVVPLRSFREFAFVMTAGVLLDTFVVRSLLVPALTSLFGEVAWWPGRRLARVSGAAIVGRVADRAGLRDDEAEADRVLRATLSTLSERITRREARALCTQLPAAFRTALTGVRRHAEPFGLDEFTARIGARAEVGSEQALAAARAVLATLDELVDETTMAAVRGQLGADYGPLAAAAGCFRRDDTPATLTPPARWRGARPRPGRGAAARTWRSSPHSDPGATNTCAPRGGRDRRAVLARDEIHANGTAAGAAEGRAGERRRESLVQRRRGGAAARGDLRAAVRDRPGHGGGAGALRPPLGASRSRRARAGRNGVAAAQRRHRPALGERAQHEQVRQLAGPGERRAGDAVVARELHERLVDEHGHAGGQPRGEGPQRVAAHERASRVVRRGRGRPRGWGVRHCGGTSAARSAPPSRQSGTATGRAPARAVSVGSGPHAGQGGEHDVAPGGQLAQCGLQQRARPVAEDDLRLRDPVARGDAHPRAGASGSG